MQLGELLITATLRHEMPELEAEHGSLIKQRAKNALEIQSLEDQVLHAINTTSTEALLEESEVFNMLVALQASAYAIKSKVHRIEDSQRRINDVRTTIDKACACDESALTAI
ncbi:uncharacterized protein HaLaN_28274 [Haematococcus lacustris]|uniref:Dynein heavy chain ATP-binding dynein motor region domain-containing protein n=1 Tax=Haematococcus lacustris TaxID=44745 RepID=A0A6A0AAD2_HAELA|nr:uncharacterized protein HaLaN_28274 [Haematococcus lacustris]